MKGQLFLVLLLILSHQAFADLNTSEFTDTDRPAADFSQLISLEVGPFRPGSLAISNGSYSFKYGDDSLDSYLVELGWSARLFHLLGSVYIKENLAMTRFAGTVQGGQAGTDGQTMSVSLIGFDTRISHEWDWFPWKSVIPYIDGGYQYTLYYQSGSTDLESAQGGVGNAVAGAGVRLWLNRSSSESSDHVKRYSAFPIFLTASVNRIFANPAGLNLDSTSFMGGVTFGL